jgi:hypothetical protein
MHRVRAPLRWGSAVLGVVLLASCSDSTQVSNFEPDIAKMTITLATSCTGTGTDYTATKAANGFGGTTATVTTALFCVTGTFFKPSGAKESSLPPADFELGVSASGTSHIDPPPPLHYEPNSSRPLQGTLSGLEAGQEITLFFSLHHTTLAHDDFGPYSLKIRYTPPPPDGGGGGPPPP